MAETLNSQILSLIFADNVKSRILQSDGSYERRTVGPSEMPIDVQRVFLNRALPAI